MHEIHLTYLRKNNGKKVHHHIKLTGGIRNDNKTVDSLNDNNDSNHNDNFHHENQSSQFEHGVSGICNNDAHMAPSIVGELGSSNGNASVGDF